MHRVRRIGEEDRRETWHFQETPNGPIVIGVTDINDVQRNAHAYKESDEAFAAWFKKRVEDISGVDPNKTPLGPASEMVSTRTTFKGSVRRRSP